MHSAHCAYSDCRKAMMMKRHGESSSRLVKLTKKTEIIVPSTLLVQRLGPLLGRTFNQNAPQNWQSLLLLPSISVYGRRCMSKLRSTQMHRRKDAKFRFRGVRVPLRISNIYVHCFAIIEGQLFQIAIKRFVNYTYFRRCNIYDINLGSCSLPCGRNIERTIHVHKV